LFHASKITSYRETKAHLELLFHGKNDFIERCKILLDIDQKIILLDHQNNFVGILKIMSNAAKNFQQLVSAFHIIILIDSSNKIIFLIFIQLKF